MKIIWLQSLYFCYPLWNKNDIEIREMQLFEVVSETFIEITLN